MNTRDLSNTGIKVSAIGLGCWAMGGPTYTPAWEGKKRLAGWGTCDDNISAQAIHKALDLGITLFDTADIYGCGHSEKILGQALAEKRDKVIIATKFGVEFNEQKIRMTGFRGDPEYIKKACDASLKRLNTDYIDLYQFHLGGYDSEEAPVIREVLEELVTAGKIRYYGWSTDDPEKAGIFAEGAHCAAVQYMMNIMSRNQPMVSFCEKNQLAGLIRTPLGMGLLTGKFKHDTKLPKNDVRHNWNFEEGDTASQLDKLQALRNILQENGRTLAQGALGWLLAVSSRTIPIPGFTTIAQVEENSKAGLLGPLTAEQMTEIDRILDL